MNPLITMVIVISSAGAFGGIVLGIIQKTSYTIRLPGNNKLQLGFVGDALVGAAASLAICSIATPILNIDLVKINDAQECLKAIAVAIIAGFAGLSLLQRLSSQLINRVGEIDKEVEEISEKVESLELAQKCNPLFHQGDFHLRDGNFEEALEFFEHALGVFPEDKRALIGKGCALKRMGRVEEALETVNKVLKIDPNYDLALYNRSCYRALLNFPIEEVLSDLRKAISIFSTNRNIAKKDSDFKSIINDNSFQETIGIMDLTKQNTLTQ